ncbi:hypothetical protein PPERSA_06278 [Pseudocohnilembus persalinus]|uniref:Acid ceramidase N-terminal domain-containing protein n=1 Tax=Pseudocohnilembus persalinus TaxID=266149 RepID=A0A0V0QV73_PSEPJ|nr:hypothetical protein PPERSA_06278 [Pseudocohnilembus persalinus]|eukprot:KRX06307.1 hypothetical protein PPERSA_06278 [Pseudocohnilembus persalinus]
MKKLLVIFLVLAVASCSIDFALNMIPHIGEIKDVETPRYSINLDDEPRHRWDHIVPTFKPAIQKFIKLVDGLNIPKTVFTGLALFAETQASYKEFVAELKGIGEKAEVDWKKLLLSNFLYDISSILPHANFCSSIVALQKDGTCIHGRNLDFFPWSLLSKDSAYIDVYQGGEHIATFHQPIGAVMVLSGIRTGSFSVTVDTRKYTIDGEDNKAVIKALVDNIIVKKYVPSTFLTRNVLQTKGITYEQARDALKNTDTTAPIYYVVAGLNAGSLIEKQPVGYHGFYEIGPNGPDGEWFIVQTNYDRWEDPGSDQRRTPAEKRLKSIGQNRITLDILHEEVMAQYPTLNIASIYTSMLYPTTGRNDLKLLYGNIDNIRKSSNLMDPETTIFNDSLRDIVDSNQGMPEDDKSFLIEYFNKSILEWVERELPQEILA